jgi:hypothetical protein
MGVLRDHEYLESAMRSWARYPRRGKGYVVGVYRHFPGIL